MHIEEFRDYCLSLPHTYEGTPFSHFPSAQSVLVFYVGDRMFCYFDMERFDACTIKCDPVRIDELKARYCAVDKPYNGNPKYWISVRFNDDMPDREIRALVKNSYDLVVAGLPKKEKKSLEMA